MADIHGPGRGLRRSRPVGVGEVGGERGGLNVTRTGVVSEPFLHIARASVGRDEDWLTRERRTAHGIDLLAPPPRPDPSPDEETPQPSNAARRPLRRFRSLAPRIFAGGGAGGVSKRSTRSTTPWRISPPPARRTTSASRSPAGPSRSPTPARRSAPAPAARASTPTRSPARTSPAVRSTMWVSLPATWTTA